MKKLFKILCCKIRLFFIFRKMENDKYDVFRGSITASEYSDDMDILQSKCDEIYKKIDEYKQNKL